MKRCLVLTGVWLFLLASGLPAQTPDEKYVRIYNLIQEADGLLASGQLQPAALKYWEAQNLLKPFPTAHAGWNEKVVSYRLNYLAAKLESLGTNLPPVTTTTNQPAAVTPPPVAPPISSKSLQEEIVRLTRENAELQAKLKEALSVQPAASDPRELAKAEERIKQLQKEVDLLKVSLELEQGKSARAPDPSTADQERQLVTELKQKLAQQSDLATSLQKDNDALKQQIAELRLQTHGTNLVSNTEELRIAQTTIAALQATNIALRTDKIMLEGRLDDIVREGAPASSARIKSLTKERDELKKKLAAVMKELERKKNRATTLPATDAAQQLDAALARLDALEAKAVPYTPEELVLLKQGATNVAVNVPNPDKVTVRELPAGAGPLMAEAERAVEGRRFDEAEKFYQQVLRQDENHVYTLDRLAMLQIKQNRWDDADKTIAKALSLDPKDPNTLFLLGHLRFKQEKYDQAFDALSLAARLRPEDAWTQFFLGETLNQKGDRSAAETALRKALQLRPGWPDAHHALAQVYAMQQPPFKELAQWHYGKARDAGYPRNEALEKLLEGKPAADRAQQ